jgi:hypothetical protein
MKKLWGKIFKKKKTNKPPLTEGNTKGGNGYVKEPSTEPKTDIPPPPPLPPPMRIIEEDVVIKKPKKPQKKTRKKRSVNKMALPEIVYKYYQCECEEWKKHLPQIVEQQQYAVNRSRKEGINLAYDMKPFVYCPWCGWKRYRSNRGKKANK